MKDEIKEKFKEKHKKEIEEINNQFEELIKDDEIKEILECIKNRARDYVGINGCLYQDLKREELNLLLDYITKLQEENEELHNLCDEYEKEHNTTFQIWKQGIEKDKIV